MKIKVLYFASLRDKAGENQSEFDVPEGALVSDFREALKELTGFDESRIKNIRAAVNDEFCDDTILLKNGDELAWIPPVSGGTC